MMNSHIDYRQSRPYTPKEVNDFCKKIYIICTLITTKKCKSEYYALVAKLEGRQYHYQIKAED